jgi:hypothetical protein
MGGGKGGGSKSVTVGYKYYMGMHMVICHGPVDSLNQIYAGERQIRGLVSSSSRILISAENVFGGEEKEGGIKGYVDVMFGEPTQTANSYLQSKVSSQMPAFRGVLSIVCNQIYFAAMNPYPKPWWFEVTRIPQSDWEPSYAEPRTGSANGAHIIRELITNTTWGMGYPISQIDNTSFVDAAETLYNENFGVSFILAAQGQIEDLLQQVLRHINGVLVSDRFTGLFKLKLIRDDYTVGNLPTFDDSNIIALIAFNGQVTAKWSTKSFWFIVRKVSPKTTWSFFKTWHRSKRKARLYRKRSNIRVSITRILPFWSASASSSNNQRRWLRQP